MAITRRTLMRSSLSASAAPSLAAQTAAPSAASGYPYEIWDVFTSQRLTGNPLAVFPDARGLSDAQMLAIARETNLSESTFVFPRQPQVEAAEGILVRIFTPTQELPFAGHPTLGTAMALHARQPDSEIRLQFPAGIVPVRFSQPQGTLQGVMVQPEPVFAETHSPAAVAPCIGLPVDAIHPDYPIQNVSTGRPKLIVLLRSLDALRRVQVDFAATARYFAGGDPQRAFYFLTEETVDSRARFHARYPIRSGEDPVTGAAGGCAIAWAVAHGLVASGETIVIEQGHEIRRPGQMTASATSHGGRISNVRIGGGAVKCAEGRLYL